MKLKSLLFGSAAVLAAGTGAQAADLPTVEPVEYVRICDAFGTGFFYIPGTDTCLKLSGYVRHESHFVDGVDEGDIANRYRLQRDSLANNWTTRTRGHVEWDARTQTDIGLVRAFIAIEGTRGPQNAVPNINAEDASYGSGVTLASAFVQVSGERGTFTSGKFGSFFDFFGSHCYCTRVGIEDGTTDPNLVAWTFAGGNGFSFSIALEDPKSTGRRKTGDSGSELGDDDYEGMEAPDGVVNIRVDQGWGSAQLMGAVRMIHDKTTLPPGIIIKNDGGDDQDGVGFAVGGGLRIGIPGGWEAVAQAGYADGAVGYVWSDLHGLGDFDGPKGEDTNKAFGVRGGVQGGILNGFTVWADGNWVREQDSDEVDELTFWAVAVGGRWEPAPGLRIGPEFAFNSFDFDDDGADDDREDFDVWGVMWRMQRNF